MLALGSFVLLPLGGDVLPPEQTHHHYQNHLITPVIRKLIVVGCGIRLHHKVQATARHVGFDIKRYVNKLSSTLFPITHKAIYTNSKQLELTEGSCRGPSFC